jgi:hypothetical protein
MIEKASVKKLNNDSADVIDTSCAKAVTIQDNRPQIIMQRKQMTGMQRKEQPVAYTRLPPSVVAKAGNQFSNEPVVQRALSGAVLGGAVLGTIGSLFGPLGIAAGGLAGAAAGHFIQEYFSGPQQGPAPPHVFTQPTDTGSFAGNLHSRAAFNTELENYVNVENEVDLHTNTLRVSNARLHTTGQRLNAREQAQRGYVQQELNNPAGPAIFDPSINNHAAKNALWAQLLPVVDAGQNTGAGPIDPNLGLKIKTSLAQIVGTDEGHDLFSQVQQLSAQFGVPINYVEDDQAQDFNLTVSPTYGGAANDVLSGLTVRVPPNNLYDDAQSFKRISDTTPLGNTDIQHQGQRISPSPIDSDLFHEFTHGLHYLKMEERRQNNVAGHQQDHASYDEQIGGTPVIGAQHEVSEARTIHRNQSYGDLIAEAGNLVNPLDLNDPFTPSVDALNHVSGFTQNIPAENDFRERIGLSPRQDHYAARLQNNGTYAQLGLYPILSQ